MSLRGKIPGFGTAENPDPTDVSLGIPVNRAHKALTNDRRAYTLRFVSRMDAGEGVPLDRVAEYVAARENGTSARELTGEQTKRVYVALYQAHLERLDEIGLLEFEKHPSVLYATPETHEAVAFMDVCALMSEGRE